MQLKSQLFFSFESFELFDSNFLVDISIYFNMK